MNAPSPNANRQIARAAGTVMAAFVISQLVGLLRMILLARTFGTGAEIDAFNAANRVAETIFALTAGGALASAFIPTFTGLLTRDDRQGAWKLASAILNWILIITSTAAILAAIFARPIVHYLLAPGFEGLQEDLAVDLMRLMLPSAVIFAVSGLIMGILNSYQVFLVPALTPALYSLGIIFGLVALTPRLGVYGLGWGVLIGASLHLALQLPALLKRKEHYYPSLGIHLEDVREVGRLMGPRLLGVAVVQLNFWINVRLASNMADGSLTAIQYAFTLMLMPQAAIAQSIATAAMPTFSAQAARGQLDEMRASLVASLRGVLLLALPAALGLIMLRTQAVGLLLQYGEFDDRSTQLVAWALLWYAAGLVSHSLVEVLVRAFYALHDTKTPVFIGALAMGMNAVLSITLAALFARVEWLPHGGLALANTVATTLELVGLAYLMRRRLNGLDGRRMLAGAVKVTAAGLFMTLVLWVWIEQAGSLPDWLIALVGIALGGGVYLVSVFALKVKEVRGILAVVQARLHG